MQIRHALVTLAIIAAVSIAIVRSGGARSIALQTSDRSVAVRVAYGDLDLASPAGAKAVLGRIRTAARQICGARAGEGLEGRVEYSGCVDSVTQQAIARLGSPLVASLNGRAMGASNVMVSASR